MHDGENIQPTISVKTLLMQHREDSKSELFELQHDKGSLSNAFARSAGLPVFRDAGSPSAAAKLVEFPEKAADGSLGANRSSETFPYVPYESRVSGCEQETRLSIPRGFAIHIG